MASTPDPEPEQKPKRLRTLTIGWLAFAWATFVISVLAWQSYNYQGIIGALGEWQFRTFDRFFPIATIALLTAILIAPFGAILLIRIRRYARDYSPGRSELIHRAELSQRFHQLLIAISLAGAIVLLVVGILSVGVNEKPYPLSVAQMPPADLSGRATLRGNVRFDRIGYYRERFILVGRDLWVAPVVPSQGTGPIRYFVQVNRQQARAGEVMAMTGYLRSQALPGGLRRLYENAGYDIGEPTYVLFITKADVRWPWFSAAGQLALLGLASFVFLLLGRRHLRKLQRDGKSTGHVQN